MNLLDKLLTALRGVASETGEAIIDSQGIRIMEQEIRDAKEHLVDAKESLTSAIAEQMGVQRKIKQLATQIEEHEGYALKALDKEDEALALEVAEKIAGMENEKEALETTLESYSANVDMLKEAITTTEQNLKSMERELALIKTTESVQKAGAAVAAKSSGTNSSLRSATESLERIKAKQQKRADQMEAALNLQKEETGKNLHLKLEQAGIVNKPHSGKSVLEKLKTKHH